jgi:hypothetical protein
VEFCFDPIRIGGTAHIAKKSFEDAPCGDHGIINVGRGGQHSMTKIATRFNVWQA